MKFEFEGIEELIRELDRMEQVTEELKDKALISGGDLLRDRMKAEVYAHGLDKITGEAYESITRTDPKNNELYVGVEGGNSSRASTCTSMNSVTTTSVQSVLLLLDRLPPSLMKTRNRTF